MEFLVRNQWRKFSSQQGVSDWKGSFERDGPVSGVKIKKCLNEAEWLYMMDMLGRIDVRTLELELPAWDYPQVKSRNSVFESVYGMDHLGRLLRCVPLAYLNSLRITITRSGRSGRGRNLETTACDRIQIDDHTEFRLNRNGSSHLARALKSGRLQLLKDLSLPACADVPKILKALEDGRIYLSRFSIMSTKVCSQRILGKSLDSVLEGGFFKKLQYLELSNSLDGFDGWEVFSRAINSGKLPKDISLILGTKSVEWDRLRPLLGSVLLSGLNTLEIISTVPDDPAALDLKLSGVQSEPGQFRKLLTLPLAVRHVPEVLEALKAGPISRLQHLELCNGLHGVDAWEALTRALYSGKLPNVTSLRLSQNGLNQINLADLVPLLLSNCLEVLIMDDCFINSKQVWGLADAIMNGPGTGLALKHLDVRNNMLGGSRDILSRDSGVDALVKLANSDFLPQLQILDLSMNSGSSEALVRLMKTIELGHLPNLESLNWGRTIESGHLAKVESLDSKCNLVSDEAGEVVWGAYYKNEDITTEINIDWNQVRFPVRMLADDLRHRNTRISVLKKENKELKEKPEGLTSAKVFFGGCQEVGKTTLRNALSEDPKLRKYSLSRKLKRPVVPRTRGIELSQVEQGGVTLTLWDLAGQEDYHVLHGTFFPDLGLTRGRATTFVLVFRADLQGDVKKDLLYWLRFAASSSTKFFKRHVVIVLNRFEGKPCTENDKIVLKGWLEEYRVVFEEYVDIHTDPFEMDVRDPVLVQPLKNHLFERAQILLENVKVPKVCFKLQKKIHKWLQRNRCCHLPIMTWQAFEAEMGRQSSGKDYEAAALYLHEIGWIIFFKERNVVVLDPSWFCSKIVGELLLPQNMLEASDGIRRQVEKDGSMNTCIFTAHLEEKMVAGTKSDDVISVLERIGVCYKKGTKEKFKLFFPALNQQEDYGESDWGCQRSYGQVMGRRLAVEEDHWSAIPVTVFRHFQVELATNLKFGGRDDSDYRAGKSFSTFKVGVRLVLIEFNVDHSNPANDCIDILVKNRLPRQDSTNSSVNQVNVVCEMMEMVQKLCAKYCPGLKYDTKVIQPWSASGKTTAMNGRKLMSLQQIKGFLMKDQPSEELYLSWQVNGEQVKMETCLSDNELELVLKLKSEMKGNLEIRRRTNGVRDYSDVLTLGAIQEIEKEQIQQDGFWADLSSDAVEDSEEPDIPSELVAEIEDNFGGTLQEVKEAEEESGASALSRVQGRATVEDQNNGHRGLTNGDIAEIRAIVQLVLRKMEELNIGTRQHLEELHIGTRQHQDEGTKRILMKAEELMLKINAHHSFSIQEKEKSVPRFVILREKNASGVWSSVKMAIKKPFQEDFLLHFLCESRFDDGNLHWVKGQKGLKLSKNSSVAEKLSEAEPWVRWSLYVAALIAKVTLNVLIPPSGNLIPTLSTTSTMDQEKIGNRGVKMLQNDGEIYPGNSDFTEELARLVAESDLRTDELLIDVKTKLLAEGVFHEVVKEKGMDRFLEGTRLRRVVIDNDYIRWICVDCLSLYGTDRVRDITLR